MDFLQKALAQVSDLFRSMTPGARITAGLLLGVIVVSLLYLFRFQTTSADEYLLGGRPFSAAEIAMAEAAFAKENLARSEVVGNKIKIPRGEKAAYLAALANNNALPEDFGTALATAATNENPFLSQKSLEVRMQAAKQKELSLIISRMRGVEVATVTFDEVDKPGFVRRKDKSAMVAVQPSTGEELTQEQVRAIRNTVAAAYAGLDRNHVTVTDIVSGRSYAGVSADGVGSADDNLYAEAKLRYERDWQAKIYDRLRMIPGVVVGVNVDLDRELWQQTVSHKVDPKAVTVQQRETTETISSTMPANSGRPGAVPNSLVNAPASVNQERGAQSSTERSDASNASVVGQEQSTVRHVGLTPRQVQVVVDIPFSYYRKIWMERNPIPRGQEPKLPPQPELDKIEAETRKRIEDTVVKLLPRPDNGNDPFIPVTVTSYQDLAQAPLPVPTAAESALAWLAENWQTIGMVLLGLMSLLMLRSMVRPASTPPTPAQVAAQAAAAQAAADAADRQHEEEEPAVEKTRRRFNSSGPTLRDELREMVKENPDAAAEVLRAWIGDAA